MERLYKQKSQMHFFLWLTASERGAWPFCIYYVNNEQFLSYILPDLIFKERHAKKKWSPIKQIDTDD